MAVRPSFFAELKRRNVVRAAVLYAGAVWALSQGISQLSGPLGLPNWVTVWFLIACALGFPFWIAFAWMYEITPQGIKRESEVAPSESVTRATGRKLDFAIIAVLAVAVLLLGTNEYMLRRHRVAAVTRTGHALAMAPAPAQAAAEVVPAPFNPPAGSLVVLPFKNLSGEASQQYFSDGITEELTDALGQNPALRVIARQTAATLRSPSLTANEVGRKLNVANLLNGSIEREGDEVRITVELVDTRNGRQLWSQHYDDSFADIFKVQDQVSASIAAALKVKFAQADLPQGGTDNPEAHELVLKGRALLEQHDVASFALAQEEFEQAVKLDPDYADAYAAFAGALVDRTNYSDLSFQDAAREARTLAQKALALDPHNADALVVLGNLDVNEFKTAQAQDEYRRALALDPSNANAHVDYALTLPVTAKLAEVRKAVSLDPSSWVARINLALIYAYLHSYTRMLAPAQAMLQLNPRNVDGTFLLAFAYRQLHQDVAAAKAFDLAKPATALDRLQIHAGRLTYQSLMDPPLRPQALAAVGRLHRAKLSPYSQRNLIQLYLALGETTPTLHILEGLCPSFPIACSDLGIFPMFQPLRSNPRFEALAQQYTTATAQ